MQDRLQPVLPIALGNNRGASIEIDVQVLSLSGSDCKASACDLTGGDLESRFGLARKQKRVHAIVCGEHNAVGRSVAFVARNRSVVGREHYSNLLVGTCL